MYNNINTRQFTNKREWLRQWAAKEWPEKKYIYIQKNTFSPFSVEYCGIHHLSRHWQFSGFCSKIIPCGKTNYCQLVGPHFLFFLNWNYVLPEYVGINCHPVMRGINFTHSSTSSCRSLKIKEFVNKSSDFCRTKVQ